MDNDPNRQILRRSLMLSQPYWIHYERLIGPTNFVLNNDNDLRQDDSDESASESSHDSEETLTQNQGNCEYMDEENTAAINAEYLAFIKVTRQHQAERDRLKSEATKRKNPLDMDEYYKDISQVNTLIEDNLVEPPPTGIEQSQFKTRKQHLIELYGSREAYDKIRSIEMQIDENFNRKLQELSPKYWPVMPINPKPYLNPMK